jgi:4-hydroxythreonine-4-phosphate dehydrogenase
MMLAGPDLRVVPTTIHIALKDVPGALDAALLSDTIRITDAALRRDFGVESPRIAVAGLNPHAGEGGVMGREEIEIIAPVIEALAPRASASPARIPPTRCSMPPRAPATTRPSRCITTRR